MKLILLPEAESDFDEAIDHDIEDAGAVVAADMQREVRRVAALDVRNGTAIVAVDLIEEPDRQEHVGAQVMYHFSPTVTPPTGTHS